MVVILAGVVLVTVAVMLAVVGLLGTAARLPRNRWAGVRTPTSLASAEAFTLANRAAGPGIGAGALMLALAGTALLSLEGAPRAVAALLLGFGGVATVIAAGSLGRRAVAVDPAAGRHARCATCTGCVLMDSLAR